MLRRFAAAFLSLALLCVIPASAAVGSGYSDVPSTDWSVDAIEKATDYGLMEGIGNGQFGFGQLMNRASFIKVLCNMFQWAEVKPAAPAYPDMPSHWAYGWVESALAHGALEAGGTFRPDEAITREEMAVILVRALDYDQLALSLKDAALPFPDVTAHRGYIALAYRFGIINGGIAPDGQLLFFPTSPANRETCAAMLVRAYERYTAKIDWLHGFYAFDSYGQIGLTAQMDAVSVGWARLDVDAATGSFLNQTTKNGNEWTVPSGSAAATDTFAANHTPYNLNVFTSANDSLTLADGTQTSDLHALLATEESRAQGAAVIAAAVAPYHGITIDFEGLREDKKDAFTSFMKTLRAALPSDKTLWVAVQPPDWFKGFDYKALGEICDKVILMAHDYKWSNIPAGYVGSTAADPVSPFSYVCSALTAITDPATGVQDKSKIALAIAIDSGGYEVDSSGKIATTTLYAPGVSTLTGRLRQPDAVRGWSDTYRNAYITYTGDVGKTYKIWYEDARGVAEKVKLAAMFGINGVSLWRIGNIPNVPDAGLDYDVWAALMARR